jgi:hypothetical protein
MRRVNELIGRLLGEALPTVDLSLGDRPAIRRAIVRVDRHHTGVFAWRPLDLGRYDVAIANPPFGRVKRSGDASRYRGPEFELHIMDIARELAERGAFIVPQESASFRYSGRPYFDRRAEGRAVDFEGSIRISCA